MLLGDLAVWLLLISLEVSRLKCTNSTLKKPPAIQHWKHLLYEHFSFLQLDLVLAAKSMRHLKAGKMLNVPQLCINMQAGTSPLVLDGGQFVLTFKIELQGKMTKKPNLFSQSVSHISQSTRQRGSSSIEKLFSSVVNCTTSLYSHLNRVPWKVRHCNLLVCCRPTVSLGLSSSAAPFNLLFIITFFFLFDSLHFSFLQWFLGRLSLLSC